VFVEEVTLVTAGLVEGMARLLPQLSSTAGVPTAEELEDIVASPTTVLFAAREDDEIVGTLTLVVFRLPTGVRAWIEDVVVDETARGRGVSSELTRAALDRARYEGARTVDLTSRPSREVANRVYEHLGFTKRETNVYRYDLLA
jgi:ribosomal protein S18 acetylase RimI-like enzyme